MIPNFNISKINNILKKLKSVRTNEPFNENILSFLIELGKEIKKKKISFKYPELIALSFFCREANLKLLKEKFSSNNFRVGKGIIFHITPTNIPINFAYSLIFGLLAGNINIVRIPSKNFNQVKIFHECLNKVCKKKKFYKIKKSFFLIKYERNDEITKLISSKSDVRIIWGGDDTVRHIKKIPIPEKSLDIAFPDRYSFCIININELKTMTQNNIKQLAYKFFNDTYSVDQNACSSPHMVIWIGKYHKDKINLFWNELSNLVISKYNLAEGSAFEKYSLLLKNLAQKENLKINKKYSNYLYRVKIKKFNDDIINLRGKFGLFYECNMSNVKSISKFITNKIQTITYVGFKKEELIKFIKEENPNGIDRIVPIGTALDIGLIWDGYDLIKTLSREIEIR